MKIRYVQGIEGSLANTSNKLQELRGPSVVLKTTVSESKDFLGHYIYIYIYSPKNTKKHGFRTKHIYKTKSSMEI